MSALVATNDFYTWCRLLCWWTRSALHRGRRAADRDGAGFPLRNATTQKHARTRPRSVGRSEVEGISQRELNLAFGAGQRQAFSFLWSHQKSDDGDLHGFAVFR